MDEPKIEWHHFPKSTPCPIPVRKVISVFEEHLEEIHSQTHAGQYSNKVLDILRPSLQELDFKVETDKTKAGKIRVPVLFGANGAIVKHFEADAYNARDQIVLEIEAGRAVSNYQFLKDLFQACVMQQVEYSIIAVRQVYRGGKDYEKVLAFIETLYASDRLVLPLKGLIIIGY